MHPIAKPTGTILTICFVVLVSLAGSAGVRAATLADYQHRVAEAIRLIEQLRFAHEDPSQREHSVITTFARVREDLPAKETVILDSQAVVVDNTWLHEALQNYERTDTRRVEALTRIEERLRALKERLEEIQPANESDKDAAKGRLAEILRRPEYNKPATPEGSAIGRLWARFLRWFFSLFRPTKPITPSSSRYLSGFAQIVVVAACLSTIALLIWKFAPRYLSHRRGRKKKREARIVLGERLEPDQTAADLLAQAESLARQGDLRGAIRKAYIALLCELGDRKIVSLAQHKTNRDYLNSVRERAPLYSSMRRLTISFELHWYGFRPVVENDWNEFRSGYEQILKAGPGR
jgi:hypothetical protein